MLPVAPNRVRITTDAEPVLTGFKLYLDKNCTYSLDNGEYEEYTTLYRAGEGWYELSNDGSVYEEPVIESVEPTEEELAAMELNAQRASIMAQISSLEKQIADTDYQIIKMYEYSLVGLETEYDIEALHAERQALRDRINELEAQLVTLSTTE